MSRRKEKLKKLRQQLRILQSRSPAQDPNPLISAEAGPRQIVERLVNMSMMAEHYSGPIPPPAMLEEYNKVVPGFADRIMQMAEKQLVHRHDLEATVVKGRAASEQWATHYAFILAVLFGAGALYLVKSGYSIAGISLLIGDITTLAGIFVFGRIMQRKENQEKLKALSVTSRPQRPPN